MNKIKKIILVGGVLVLSLGLFGCGKTNNKTVQTNEIDLKDINREVSIQISEKMVKLEKDNHNDENKVSVAGDVYLVDIVDKGLKDFKIEYGNDNLTGQNLISLMVNMKVENKEFKLEDFKVLNDAMKIIYGEDSKFITEMEAEVNKGLRESILKGYSGKVGKNKDDFISVMVKADEKEAGLNKLFIVCTRIYK